MAPNAEVSKPKTKQADVQQRQQAHTAHLAGKKQSLDELIHLSDPFIMKVCIALVMISIGLFAIDIYFRKYKPPGTYFAVFEDNHIEKMRALQYPNLSTDVILQWAMEAATASYTFDFYNYPTVLKNIRPYFTKAGYDNFISALNSAGTLKRVEEKKIIVSAVPTGTPIILKEGKIVGGIYAWQVQFPMLLTFQSQSDKSDSKVIVTLLIAQVPTLESPKGIGIASFITGEALK